MSKNRAGQSGGNEWELQELEPYDEEISGEDELSKRECESKTRTKICSRCLKTVDAKEDSHT